MKLPTINTKRLNQFIENLRGQHHAAGLIIEESRIRFAEFQPKKIVAKGRVLEYEGAVLLPHGVIREGELNDPPALTHAVRELCAAGRPNPLITSAVTLSLPLAQIVGKIFTLPSSVQRNAWGEALRLEAERTLPFPITEAYFDWQELKAIPGEKKDAHAVFFLAARRPPVDAYIKAVQEAGLSIIAVEPVTLSIARGLENRTGITYAAILHDDIIFATAMDPAGNTLAIHHRTFPMTMNITDRAQKITNELASFVRYVRTEIHQIEQEIIVDGIVNETTLQSIREIAATFSLSFRYEPKAHILSRAAARGAGLRAIIPRAEDRFVSLMEEGTETAFAASRSAFVYRVAAASLIGALTFSSLLLGATSLYFSSLEHSSRNAHVGESENTQIIASDIQRFNSEVSEATSLLPSREIPGDLYEKFFAALPEGVTIENFTASAQSEQPSVDPASHGVLVSISGTVRNIAIYESFLDILHQQFTDTPLNIPPELQFTKPIDIPMQLAFTLR